MHLLWSQLHVSHDPESEALILIFHHRWNREVARIYTATQWRNRLPRPAQNHSANPGWGRRSCHGVKRQKFFAKIYINLEFKKKNKKATKMETIGRVRQTNILD